MKSVIRILLLGAATWVSSSNISFAATHEQTRRAVIKKVSDTYYGLENLRAEFLITSLGKDCLGNRAKWLVYGKYQGEIYGKFACTPRLDSRPIDVGDVELLGTDVPGLPQDQMYSQNDLRIQIIQQQASPSGPPVKIGDYSYFNANFLVHGENPRGWVCDQDIRNVHYSLLCLDDQEASLVYQGLGAVFAGPAQEKGPVSTSDSSIQANWTKLGDLTSFNLTQVSERCLVLEADIRSQGRNKIAGLETDCKGGGNINVSVQAKAKFRSSANVRRD